MSMTLAGALTAIEGRAELSVLDVRGLRRLMSADGESVTRPLADRFFQLNHTAVLVSDEWRRFFVDTLADFIARECGSTGALNEELARWLMSKVAAREIIRQDVVELLITVLEQVDSAPWAFAEFVFLLVKDIILWKRLHNRTVHACDIELLRRVLFAQSHEGRAAVSRCEADALFELGKALAGGDHPKNWPNLFIQSVAASIVFEPKDRTGAPPNLPQGSAQAPSSPQTPYPSATNDDDRLAQGSCAYVPAKETEQETRSASVWLTERLSHWPLDDAVRAMLVHLSQEIEPIDLDLSSSIRLKADLDCPAFAVQPVEPVLLAELGLRRA